MVNTQIYYRYQSSQPRISEPCKISEEKNYDISTVSKYSLCSLFLFLPLFFGYFIFYCYTWYNIWERIVQHFSFDHLVWIFWSVILSKNQDYQLMKIIPYPNERKLFTKLCKNYWQMIMKNRTTTSDIKVRPLAFHRHETWLPSLLTFPMIPSSNLGKL